jgi:hypothetical protein
MTLSSLAKPTKDGKDIEPLHHVHAGGLAWVGRYLYVSDTKRGLRVFDLQHMWRADTGSKEYKVANGRVSAGGYRYLLPQIGFYTYSEKGEACQNGALPVQSSVSVDRKTKLSCRGSTAGAKQMEWVRRTKGMDWAGSSGGHSNPTMEN